jgi:hypothetical protein
MIWRRKRNRSASVRNDRMRRASSARTKDFKPAGTSERRARAMKPVRAGEKGRSCGMNPALRRAITDHPAIGPRTSVRRNARTTSACDEIGRVGWNGRSCGMNPALRQRAPTARRSERGLQVRRNIRTTSARDETGRVGRKGHSCIENPAMKEGDSSELDRRPHPEVTCQAKSGDEWNFCARSTGDDHRIGRESRDHSVELRIEK